MLAEIRMPGNGVGLPVSIMRNHEPIRADIVPADEMPATAELVSVSLPIDQNPLLSTWP